MPLEKIGPRPRRTTTRTAGSSRTDAMARARSSRSAWLIAFRLSGRLRMSEAVWPCRSTVARGSDILVPFGRGLASWLAGFERRLDPGFEGRRKTQGRQADSVERTV